MHRMEEPTMASAIVLCALLIPQAISQPASRPVQTARFSLAPWPAELEPGDGELVLTPSVVVKVSLPEPQAARVAERWLDDLRGRTRWALPVQPMGSPAAPCEIRLLCDPLTRHYGPEGYELAIEPASITIRFADDLGLLRGTQTLAQFFPPLWWASPTTERLPAGACALPIAKIRDWARFRWRGLLLDESRHFFGKEFVLRLLDAMSQFKLNVFHWHLTDSQGWRLESQAFPKLTQIGAWRTGAGFGFQREQTGELPWDSRGRYGGYYSRDDVRAIVAFAKERGITIVPEIEMPGHAQAWIAAYPELSCDGMPHRTASDYSEQTCDVLCVSNPALDGFLEKLLPEIAELFPSEWIHVGGDEVNPAFWNACSRCRDFCKKNELSGPQALQAHFEKRVEAILTKLGKRLVGWDEILEGGLPPRATVMSWRGTSGGIAAARRGHEVVMSPTTHCYFDYPQASSGEPKNGGGLVPLRRVYSYEPIPAELAAEHARFVLGVQGNLWTEWIPNGLHAEYMAFPRAIALAEVGWSQPQMRSWEGFRARLPKLLERLSSLGVAHRVPKPGEGDPPRMVYSGVATTSMAVYGDFAPELAFDGNLETYFWSEGVPAVGQHLTLELRDERVYRSVSVATGKPDRPDDVLVDGVVEVRIDGAWRTVGKSQPGDFELRLPAEPVEAVRLRSTAPHGHWLVVREVTLK